MTSLFVQAFRIIADEVYDVKTSNLFDELVTQRGTSQKSMLAKNRSEFQARTTATEERTTFFILLC